MAPYFPPWRRRAPQPKLGLEVITKNIAQNPPCTHGPTVCFERFFVGGKSRKFYACSACRDQKTCPFFLWTDQQQPKTSRNQWLQKIKDSKPLRSHQDEYRRLSSLENVSAEERGYCTVCNMLCLLPSDPDHPPTPRCSPETIITPLQSSQLQHPSQLVPLKEASKCEAQYLFSKQSVCAVLSLVQQLGATKLLCVGVPSLHEAIKNQDTKICATSMLLDIDGRYRSFFPPTSFVRFNMFNQHFFDGTRAKQRLVNFLTGHNKLCVVCDPPFGARVELLKETFSFLTDLWRQANNIQDSNSENSSLSVLLIFPYFMETQVLGNMSELTMLDYQLEYTNHQYYTSGTKKSTKKGSAVRVYINKPNQVFKLPESEGYKHCKPCNRWVYKNNVHCDACNGCMGKDGSGYRHCTSCGRCVKPSWKHCDKCGKCQVQDHKCSGGIALTFAEAQKQQIATTCHSCGKTGHKRRDCPVRKGKDEQSESSPPKKAKRRKKNVPSSATEETSQYMNIIDDILCK
uniref:Zinc finger CCHC domain-containing protein 4-like n=1 Tax=Hirondellea gigas TaxID=1518452 RepID=A0A2P2I5B1_9CRUS